MGTLSNLCDCSHKDPRTEINMFLTQNQTIQFSSPIKNIKTNKNVHPTLNITSSTYENSKHQINGFNIQKEIRKSFLKLQNDQKKAMTFSFNQNVKKKNGFEDRQYTNKTTIKNLKTNSYKISPINSIKSSDSSYTLNTNNPLQISSKLNELIKARGKAEIYIGEKKGKIKDGLGLQIWNNNTFYFGSYKNNKANGMGKFISGDSKYKGEFKNDDANGYGIFTNNKLKYEGYWSNDLQNDYGIENWKDGSMYKGQYINGKKNGVGTYIWRDGNKYEGEFLDNNFHGYGVYYYNNNKFFLGHWDNNEKSGYGEFICKKKVFMGFYSNDKRNGFGISFWKSKKKYFIGFWKDGIKLGPSKILNDDKIIYALLDLEGNMKKIKDEHEFEQILIERGIINLKKIFDLSYEDISSIVNDNYYDDFILHK
jgi:hypothetical protein